MNRYHGIFAAIIHILFTSDVCAEFKGSGRTEDLCRLYVESESAIARFDLEKAKSIVYPAYVENAYKRLQAKNQDLYVPTYSALSDRFKETKSNFVTIVALLSTDLMSAIVSSYIERGEILQQQIQEGSVVFVDITIPTGDFVKIAQEYRVMPPSITVLRKSADGSKKWDVVVSERLGHCKTPVELRELLRVN